VQWKIKFLRNFFGISTELKPCFMSSYVKALEAVMRMFPKKINVTFKHVAGHILGECKIYEEHLPEVFKRPLIIEAFGRSWRVLEADPRENKDFVYKRKLSLVVVESERAGEYVPFHFTATIAGSMPEVVESSDYSDFGVDILEEEWRQVEMLPASYLPMVNEEIAVIEGILRPGKGVSVLKGYGTRHMRERIGGGGLNISLEEFCKVVDASKFSSLRFNGSGYVRNGFVLQSAGFTYYGTVVGGVVKDLCVYRFDCADYELFNVLSSFDMMMVHWCKGRIFTSEVSDKGEVSEESGGNDATNFM
jgi:hypothetical protein